MNNETSGVFGKLEVEYKRIVQMSSIKRGQAYFKGYITALIFAMKLIKANEEETKNENE